MNIDELEPNIRDKVDTYNQNVMDILVKLNENADIMQEITEKANDSERHKRKCSEGGKKARAKQTSEQRKEQAIKASKARRKNNDTTK